MTNVVEFPMSKEVALRIVSTCETSQDGNTVGFALDKHQKWALEWLFENERREKVNNELFNLV